MKINKLTIAGLTAATLSFSLLSATSHAFPIMPQTCGSKSADPALSCADGTGSNDKLDLVQAAYPDVDFLFDKDENGDSNTPGAPFDESDFYLTGENFSDIDFGNTTDGNFLLSDDLLAAFDIYVLVLKGGNEEPKWSMFEIDTDNLVVGNGAQNGYSYGIWSSDNQGLSHSSLYVGDRSEQIPEPGMLALLGLGLTGLGLARRKTAN